MNQPQMRIIKFIGKLIDFYADLGFYGFLLRVNQYFKIKYNFGFALGPNLGSNYVEWVRRYDSPTAHDIEGMKQRAIQFPIQPLISIIMPVYKPNMTWLVEAIESVQGQIYTHWELCIADDGSQSDEVKQYLSALAAADARVKVVFRPQNGHISAASNSAIELSSGQWLALMDNDDVLSPQALFWVVKAINDHPQAKMIYSDEDKITEKGQRYAPYFKCDWNIDLFYGHNMFSHLGVYEAELVKGLGGFREGFEGAQDHDLTLRCVEQVGAGAVFHIPRVLYHWRSHASSTAKTGDSKPYAVAAGEKALDEHFQRTNVAATVQWDTVGYRVRYALPSPQPLVSIVIPTRNGLSLLKQCVDSITAKTTYAHVEVLVVDNGSDDPATLQYLSSLVSSGLARVLADPRPFNYSALNNHAVTHAQGAYLVLMNNDIEVITPDWIEEMLGLASQPAVGAVGARLWYANDTLQHGGVITGLGGVAGHAHKHLPKGQPGFFYRAQLVQAFSAVTAACLMVKKSTYLEVGGLNEVDLTVAFNDVDFCLRVKAAGYRNVWTPHAELYHHESATRGLEDTPEKVLRFQQEAQYMQQRWGESLRYDFAYSPNLSLDHEDFSYAWPPRV